MFPFRYYTLQRMHNKVSLRTPSGLSQDPHMILSGFERWLSFFRVYDEFFLYLVLIMFEM